jgi:hypothetical protein
MRCDAMRCDQITSSVVASRWPSQPDVVPMAAAHVERSLVAPRLVGTSHELGTDSHMPLIWPIPLEGMVADSESASVAGTNRKNWSWSILACTLASSTTPSASLSRSCATTLAYGRTRLDNDARQRRSAATLGSEAKQRG